MHFDIVEAIRQKQYKKMESIRIENGKVVDISIEDGGIVISPGAPPELRTEEEIEPHQIVPGDDIAIGGQVEGKRNLPIGSKDEVG